ncbi:MAG: ComEC/Rec2 family competence protein, partial [Ruminococcus sp.]|nr:ComEC/Rec2 family competence protein [Ruminococcus sp.]
VMLILFTISVINKKMKQAAWLKTFYVTAFAACLIFTCFEAVNYYPALSLTGENVSVSAVVTDYPILNGGRYHVEAKLNNTSAKVRLSLAADSKFDDTLEETVEKLKSGDEISFKGTVYVLGGDNAKIRRSFKSSGVYLGAYPKGKVSYNETDRKSLSFIIKHERQKTINQLRSAFDSETAGVLISILLGDKTYLPDEIYSDYKSAGVAHIMAVSGLHLSIWILCMMKLIEAAGLDRRRYAVFMIAFVLLVMAFTCFSGSAVRAGIMMIMYLLGFVIGKTPDSLNSLGFSAIIILLVNPFACMDVSFLLSFLSTLAIIVFSFPLSQKLIGKLKNLQSKPISYKLMTAVIESVAISVGVFIFTFPVMLYFFGSLSLVSVITNLLILPVVMPMTVSAGLSVMFYFVPLFSGIIHVTAELLVGYCNFIVHIMASLPFSTAHLPNQLMPMFLVLYAVFMFTLLILLFKKRKSLRKIASVALVLVLVIGISSNLIYKRYTVEINVHDVGDGMCVSVVQNRHAVVIGLKCDDYHAVFVRDEIGERSAIVDTAIIIDDMSEVNTALLRSLNAEKVIDLSAEMCESKLPNVKITPDKSGIFVDAYGVSTFITVDKNADTDIIITNNEQSVLDISEKSAIILSGENVNSGFVTTGEYSDVSINIKKGGKFSVTGENSWLHLMKSS